MVIITGRRKKELEAAIDAIGPRATGMQVDSSVLADPRFFYKEIQEKWGHIDILHVNAGGGALLPLGAITEEHYEDTFGRNVKGVLFTVQKALPFCETAPPSFLRAPQQALRAPPRLASTAHPRPHSETSRGVGCSI